MFRKVTRAVAEIVAGKRDTLSLGNLDTVRDWGYCPEYAALAVAVLDLDAPDDFVIATGEGHTVRDLVSSAFGLVKLDWQKYVRVDQGLLRPSEQLPIIGNTAKLERALGEDAAREVRRDPARPCWRTTSSRSVARSPSNGRTFSSAWNCIRARDEPAPARCAATQLPRRAAAEHAAVRGAPRARAEEAARAVTRVRPPASCPTAWRRRSPLWSKLDSYLGRYAVYPRLVRNLDADLVHIVDHGQGHLVGRLDRRRTIVTCHDVILLVLAAGRIGAAPDPPVALQLFRIVARVRQAGRAWSSPTRRRPGAISSPSSASTREDRRYPSGAEPGVRPRSGRRPRPSPARGSRRRAS